MLDAADFPEDIATLKAMLIAAQAREVRKDERIERLEKLVAAFKQAAFGRKSEKTHAEQFDLALEDLETSIAAIHAEDEADSRSHSRNDGSSWREASVAAYPRRLVVSTGSDEEFKSHVRKANSFAVNTFHPPNRGAN